MIKERDTVVTFSVNCTYTIHLSVPECATDDEIEELAWHKFNDVDFGELENPDSDVLSIEQY